ncbi:EexN family lipoprotein [Pusillimonas sp. SM2304]|uniref:Entry exclusion lipoprotein TrbK n=1 Tax=Pollutimonas thiosulfatoxidans TaxID=2028345 RepID=A0A410GCA1_9BURK|nr:MULTISPECIES: EexN family lipoprotein [Alcaligenaceae]MDS1142333.1 EexN family lipoprotein [Pusillimonas sp. SM2304]QAA93921.1 entry exclusion lipoprotein TrbK [Pollutimonas thiosulfatoxidans]TEA79682.1 entry exclusion lipoprotein TrbK [Allopusillimonas ginsengisoli]TFL14334.1 entry exclusion lipoprotein TrbK [Pusillimonas caeni]
MKRVTLILLVATLSGCGQSEIPEQKPDVATVEELAADPTTLKELREQCKTDRTNMGDLLCDRVAQATRQRFYGDGTVPYTPSDTPPKF